MGKRMPSQIRVKKKSAEPRKLVPKLPVQDDKQETRNDFGGLPNRDIKKNLGCG